MQTAGSTVTTTGTSSLVATTTPTTLSNPGPVYNALDTKTQVGIGVGVAVGAILLIVLGACLNSFIRQRGQFAIKTLDAEEIGWLNRKDSRKELADTALRPQEQVSISELDGPTPGAHRVSRKELDGTHWKRELEGETSVRKEINCIWD